MDYLKLYLEFIKIKLNGIIIHRSAFFWSSVSKAAVWATEFLLIWIMVKQFKSINGWSAYEVMFLYALNLTSYSFAGFFLFGLSFSLPNLINSGEFDEVLIKPMNNFLYLVCREFNTGYFSNISISITVMVICLLKLKISFGILSLLFFIMVILGGVLIQGAAFMFSSVPAFWIIQSSGLRFIANDFRGFIRYPVSVYNKVIQVTLTFIIPYAFISFYPSQYFLKKNDFLMFNSYIQYLSPVVGIILFALAYRFWNIGVRHYKSSGS